MGFEIINTLKKEKSLTNAQIAQMSGVTLSTLDKITSGVNTNPKLDTLQAICRVLGCTLNDFVDSPKTKNAPPYTSEAMKLADDYDHQMDTWGQKAVRSVADTEIARYKEEQTQVKQAAEPPKTTQMPKAKKHGNFVEIKVYDEPAAAGLGNYLDDPPYRIEQYPEHILPQGTDFGILIDGDSMEPTVHDRSTAFVQARPSVDPGQIGIFVLNGKAYCKRLYVDHEKRQVRLISDNKQYEDIVIGEFDSFQTLGRVLGQWGKDSREDDFLYWKG